MVYLQCGQEKKFLKNSVTSGPTGAGGRLIPNGFQVKTEGCNHHRAIKTSWKGYSSTMNLNRGVILAKDGAISPPEGLQGPRELRGSDRAMNRPRDESPQNPRRSDSVWGTLRVEKRFYSRR